MNQARDIPAGKLPASASSSVESASAAELYSRPIIASSWAADASRMTCTECQQDFSFFRPRHHCRGCGELFCSGCSAFRFNNQRMCRKCFKYANDFNKYKSVRKETSTSSLKSNAAARPSVSALDLSVAAPAASASLEDGQPILQQEIAAQLKSIRQEVIRCDSTVKKSITSSTKSSAATNVSDSSVWSFLTLLLAVSFGYFSPYFAEMINVTLLPSIDVLSWADTLHFWTKVLSPVWLSYMFLVLFPAHSIARTTLVFMLTFKVRC